MTERPYEKLGYAVVTQAVEDVKKLQEYGIIKDGKVIEDWPQKVVKGKLKNRLYANYYDKPYKVKELLYWLCGGTAEEYLSMLGSSIDIEAITSKLELA